MLTYNTKPALTQIFFTEQDDTSTGTSQDGYSEVINNKMTHEWAYLRFEKSKFGLLKLIELMDDLSSIKVNIIQALHKEREKLCAIDELIQVQEPYVKNFTCYVHLTNDLWETMFKDSKKEYKITKKIHDTSVILMALHTYGGKTFNVEIEGCENALYHIKPGNYVLIDDERFLLELSELEFKRLTKECKG